MNGPSPVRFGTNQMVGQVRSVRFSMAVVTSSGSSTIQPSAGCATPVRAEKMMAPAAIKMPAVMQIRVFRILMLTPEGRVASSLDPIASA